MSKFKVGDIVKVVSIKYPIEKGKIRSTPLGSNKMYFVQNLNGSNLTYWYYSHDIILIKSVNNNNKIMNIKEKFVLALTPEPQKSFRKVGITDGDDILTDEGSKIFLSWLLNNEYSEQFKKDVVDDMLKEEKCCK